MHKIFAARMYYVKKSTYSPFCFSPIPSQLNNTRGLRLKGTHELGLGQDLKQCRGLVMISNEFYATALFFL